MELCTWAWDMGCCMNDEGKAVSGAAVSRAMMAVPGAEVASMCLVSLFITQSHARLARRQHQWVHARNIRTNMIQ